MKWRRSGATSRAGLEFALMIAAELFPALTGSTWQVLHIEEGAIEEF